MSNTKELYDDFWETFVRDFGDRSDYIGSPKKSVHASVEKPKNYYDFDLDLGNGFRATAAISKQKDTIRAELSCDRKKGLGYISSLKKAHPTNGNPLEPFVVFFDEIPTNEKLEVVWENADLINREIWPIHHKWIRNTLEQLAIMYTDSFSEQ